jgi:hypothetical protein
MAVSLIHQKFLKALPYFLYNANGQLNLFEQEESADENVYAILLYEPPQAVTPAFATVAFPSRHWNKYVQCKESIIYSKIGCKSNTNSGKTSSPDKVAGDCKTSTSRLGR